jgi:type III secretory pathway component EscV
VAGPLVVFLPLVAFATVAWIVAVKGGERVAGVARPAVRALRPGWEPALASALH